MVTFTITCGEAHGRVKVTANVPRVLFREVIEKFDELPLPIVCVAGVTSRLIGAVAETIAELPPTLRAIVPVVPPFFFIESDDGLAVQVGQPPVPPPEMGGPPDPEVLSEQSTVLLCTVLPDTTVPGAMSEVELIVAYVMVGKTLTSPLTVTSPASETSTHDCSPLLLKKAKVLVQAKVRPRQLKLIGGGSGEG